MATIEELVQQQQKQAAPQQQLGAAITPQGLVLSMPVQVQLPEEAMNQLVRQWLLAHPALADELVQQHIQQLRIKQALLQDIERSRR